MGRWVPQALLAIFVVIWFWAATDPEYPFNWFIENLLVFILVPALAVSYRWFRFSDLSYFLMFVFASLHVIGSHWTYNSVPGFDLGGDGPHQNIYDRVVHFASGLLLTLPAAEILARIYDMTTGRAAFLAFQATLALGAVYEIIEWGAAMVLAPEAAGAFLGQQGDSFDGIADMALAGAGSLVAIGGWAAWRFASPNRNRRLPSNAKAVQRSSPSTVRPLRTAALRPAHPSHRRSALH